LEKGKNRKTEAEFLEKRSLSKKRVCQNLKERKREKQKTTAFAYKKCSKKIQQIPLDTLWQS